MAWRAISIGVVPDYLAKHRRWRSQGLSRAIAPRRKIRPSAAEMASAKKVETTYAFTPDRDREPEQQPVKADRRHDQKYDLAHQVREFRAGHKSVPLVANPSGLRLLGRQHFQLADAADADVCPPFNLVTEVAAVADASTGDQWCCLHDFLRRPLAPRALLGEDPASTNKVAWPASVANEYERPDVI